MATTYFRFKSEEIVPVSDVLADPLQYPEFPPYYYLWAADQRELDGHYHITDLLLGTREAFLKYTADRIIDLDSAAPMLAGSFKHGALDRMENPFEPNIVFKTEHSVEYKGIQGRIDAFYIDYNKKILVIDDMKTGGAFSYKKYMGIVNESVPVVDEMGDPVLYKSGARKGLQKYKTETRLDPSKADTFEYDVQVSFYYYALVEKDPKLKHFTKQLWIHFMLRDGGLAAVQSQGVKSHNFREPVTLMDQRLLDHYILNQKEMLDHALKSGNCPPICPDTWDKKKCQFKYCNVVDVCQKIQALEES